MKKFLTFVSLAMILFAGITAAIQMAAMPRTYEGQNATVPVAVLQENPEAYDDSTADGAAAVIVQQNLAKSHAVNDVTSIVFDFYMGEEMSEFFEAAADFDGDGTVDLTDAVLIFEYYMNQ